MAEYKGDPLTLHERLVAKAAEDPLYGEAAQRINDLMNLCGMMTDTGVMLEEDVRYLVKPDTWWLPEDGEACWPNLSEALCEVAQPGQIVELARAHTLNNSWAVLLEEVCNDEGEVVMAEEAKEFETFQEAEEAFAEYSLRKRRVEYGH